MPRGRPFKLCSHGVIGVSRCKQCKKAATDRWLQKPGNKAYHRSLVKRWSDERPGYKLEKAREYYGIPAMDGRTPIDECLLCADVTKLVPDHDHRTGEFRGWICGRCNRALGVYETYKPLLGKFEDYLSSNKLVETKA